jgi:amino acid transporter
VVINFLPHEQVILETAVLLGGSMKITKNQMLRRQLSFVEAIAFSIAIMAPTAAMALNGSLAAGIAGSAVPLAFLLSMIAISLTSFAFVQFSRHFAHSGSIYAFNGIALGAPLGFFSGWTLLGTYLAFTALSFVGVGNFAQALFADLHIKIDWLPLALLASVIIWFLAANKITLSTRFALVLEGISVLLIAVLVVIILVRVAGTTGLTVQPFTPSKQPFSNIGLAAIFGFLAFAGFEGAASLGEETRNPRRSIPLAMLGSVVGVGLFYIIVIYAQTVGFGTNAAGITSFATSSAPLGDLSLRYVGTAMATLINFGTMISAFACGLGTANACARLLFAMGRDGFVTGWLGSTSQRTDSPVVAVAVVMVITVGLVLGWGCVPGVTSAALFGFLGTIGTLLLLVAYILTNIGAIRFFTTRRLWRWQWIVPAMAILVLSYTLYSNLYPVPAPPYNLLPYVALAWLLIGLTILVASPALVRRIGEHFKKSQQWRMEERIAPASYSDSLQN